MTRTKTLLIIAQFIFNLFFNKEMKGGIKDIKVKRLFRERHSKAAIS